MPVRARSASQSSPQLVTRFTCAIGKNGRSSFEALIRVITELIPGDALNSGTPPQACPKVALHPEEQIFQNIALVGVSLANFSFPNFFLHIRLVPIPYSLVPSPLHPSFYHTAMEKKHGERLVQIITCSDVYVCIGWRVISTH